MSLRQAGGLVSFSWNDNCSAICHRDLLLVSKHTLYSVAVASMATIAQMVSNKRLHSLGRLTERGALGPASWICFYELAGI